MAATKAEIFSSHFQTDSVPTSLNWFSQPKRAETAAHHGAGLKIHMDGSTDFWQRTYYEPEIQSDNGHFLYLPVTQDKVVMETTFHLHSINKFDQAGLMVRIDTGHWIKTGIEFSDGAWRLSCVVTNGFSDWSTTKWSQNHLTVRMYRLADSYVIERKDLHADNWEFIRIAHLDSSPNAVVKMGLYACSPVASGGSVLFDYLTLKETEGYSHK